MEIREGASAIPYNPDRDEFLLVRRAESKKEHPGLWEFPGGNVDEGETPEDAALRELKEETDLTGEIIRTGDSGTVMYPHGLYEIYPFLVLVNTEEIELSPEHTEYEWVSIDEISEYDTIEEIGRELEAVDLVSETTDVAVAVARNKDTDELLLMKRVKEMRVFPEKWEFPSGKIEEDEEPNQAVLRELKEETGLEGSIEKEGEPFEIKTDYGEFRVHPFLIHVSSKEVDTNWEHNEYQWIEIKDIDNFETVEGLKKDLSSIGALNS